MYSPRELVTDHLHVDLLAHLEPQVANEVLVNPRLKLAHPDGYCQYGTKTITHSRSTGMYLPESGLALVTLLRDRGGGGLTGSRALERSGGRVGLSSHGGVRGSGSAGGSRSGVSSRVLVLERIEVLERHDGRRVGGCKNNYNSGIWRGHSVSTRAHVCVPPICLSVPPNCS